MSVLTVLLVRMPSPAVLLGPQRPPITGAYVAQRHLWQGLLSCEHIGTLAVLVTEADRRSWQDALAMWPAAVRRPELVDLETLRLWPADAPVVLFGTTADLTPALHARHLLGEPRWPVTGITHDLSDPAVFQQLLAAQASRPRAGDALICCSRAAQGAAERLSAYARRLLRVDEERLSFPLVPHGLDLDAIVPREKAASRRALALPPEASVLAYVGRIQRGSKADLLGLIVAFGSTRFDRPVRLVIAGASEPGGAKPYLNELRRAARLATPPDSVVFIIDVDETTKQQVLASADVFVSPAQSLQESFGLALVEAMHHGLPVIASDWSGYRDIVADGETGALVPASLDASARRAWHSAPLAPRHEFHALCSDPVRIDFDALSAAMARFIADDALRARLGAAARSRAARFALGVTIDEYCDVWTSLLARARSASAEWPPLSPWPDFMDVFAGYASGKADTPHAASVVRAKS